MSVIGRVKQASRSTAAMSASGPTATSPRSSFRQAGTKDKVGTREPRTMPGLDVCCRQETRSVPRDDRATEAVIDACSDHIDVLTDRVGAEYAAGRDAGQNACRCEGDAAVTHEKMIVLERSRPIR